MTEKSTPELSEHEEEEAPFNDVLRQLLSAKPVPTKTPAEP